MDPKEQAFQLYKLEYEKAAERYDNIYRSIWTIFSYMTAIAGGIFAFGPGKIEHHALICVAFAPLLFWLFTTYLPLDRYGTKVIKRLGQIEGILNKEFGVELNHFKEYNKKELSVRKELLKALKEKSKKDFWEQVSRARFAIGLTFIILLGVFLIELFGFFRAYQPFFLDNLSEVVPVKLSIDKAVEMAPVKVVIDQSLSAAPKPNTGKTTLTAKKPSSRRSRTKQPTND
jgi:hypothetical protein